MGRYPMVFLGLRLLLLLLLCRMGHHAVSLARLGHADIKHIAHIT
jgi:hypothetical protein